MIRSLKGLPRYFASISFRSKLAASTLLAAITPFAVSAFIVNTTLSASLERLSGENSRQVAVNMARTLQTFFEQELKLCNAVSANPLIKEDIAAKNYDKASEHVRPILEKIERDYSTIAFFDHHGILKFDLAGRPIPKVDISDRDYFNKARQGLSAVTGPLYSEYSQKNIIVISSPIFQYRQFLGLIAMTMDADTAIKIVRKIRIGETGYPYVTDKKGLVLLHPNENLVLMTNILKEPGMERISKKVNTSVPDIESYTFRGIRKIAGIAPVPITGWTVFITRNLSEIMAPLHRILLGILISGLIFVALTLYWIAQYARKTSVPVEEIVETLRQIALHSREIIIGLDPARKIVFANSAAASLAGASDWKQLKKKDIFECLKTEEPPGNVWSKLVSAAVWEGKILSKNENTPHLYLASSLISVFDNAGSPKSHLFFGRDITSQHLLEKSMLQSQKMEAMGTMAGGIAHDFNNILSGIVGFAELSLKVGSLPDKSRKYLTEVIGASERARELVKQILTFSRNKGTELTQLTPGPVVEEALKLVRATTPLAIEIEADIKETDAVMINPAQLQQIIINLCANAAQSITPRTGKITVLLEQLIVDDEVLRKCSDLPAGPCILLEVADNGTGIEHQHIERVFEPFFTTKPQGEGTGLGLSTVHGIVTGSGGCISVDSEPGAGTVFRVMLPVTKS